MVLNVVQYITSVFHFLENLQNRTTEATSIVNDITLPKCTSFGITYSFYSHSQDRITTVIKPLTYKYIVRDPVPHDPLTYLGRVPRQSLGLPSSRGPPEWGKFLLKGGDLRSGPHGSNSPVTEEDPLTGWQPAQFQEGSKAPG